MSNPLTPDNYSFGGFGEPPPRSKKATHQNLIQHSRSLHSEATKLLQELKQGDNTDTRSIITTFRQLKVLNQQAKLLESTLTEEEYPPETGIDDQLQCAHHQVQQTIKEVNKELNNLQSEILPNDIFQKFFQGDPKILLFIQKGKSGQFTVIGNKDNVQKLIKSGKLTEKEVATAINSGQFGVINLREKFSCSCNQEQTSTELIPHPHLEQVNRKVSAFVDSNEWADFDNMTASKSNERAFQEGYEQAPFSSYEALEGKASSFADNSGSEINLIGAQEKLQAAQDEINKKKDEKKKRGKKEKSHGASVRFTNKTQEAAAAKRKRERMADQRTETKLKQHRDDDQNIETREDSSIQRDFD
jgi:hypothetical protein